MKPGENALHWRTLLLRLAVTEVVLATWFWTQSWLGARMPPAYGGIGDALHRLTAGLNSYFAQNKAATNALLIVSSAFIDCRKVVVFVLRLTEGFEIASGNSSETWCKKKRRCVAPHPKA